MGGSGEDENSSYEEPDHSDYADLGLVEILTDEQNDIKRILEVKDTTKDKLAYTVYCVNIYFTCFFVGYIPQYFYLWHTWKAVVLLSYRFYSYRKLHFQYFLFDFCYFTNILILIYLWLPESIIGPYFRGRLFTTCFSFANGPVLSAIVLWRNSLVPHSNDKMTSLFIHVSPSLTLWGLKWFSTPDQGFPLCSNHHTSGCSSTNTMELFYYPVIAYAAWQLIYILVVDLMCWKEVKQGNYSTSFSFIVKKKGSFMVKIFSIFGPKFRKPMFIAWQFIFTLMFLMLAYYCYFHKEINIVAVTITMTFAAYNGASFYIDVFSHKYQASHPKSS